MTSPPGTQAQGSPTHLVCLSVLGFGRLAAGGSPKLDAAHRGGCDSASEQHRPARVRDHDEAAHDSRGSIDWHLLDWLQLRAIEERIREGPLTTRPARK